MHKKNKFINHIINNTLFLWNLACVLITKKKHVVCVWIHVLRVSRFAFSSSFFFFFTRFSFRGQLALFTHCSCTVHRTHNHFIQKKKIKNGPHSTIYIFKNYFAIVFSVFNFIYFFRNFFVRAEYERNSGLKFFFSLFQSISSRFG